ncbi:hypothetical protein KUCAC02_026047, partial [Chaenocephalus aceratus]
KSRTWRTKEREPEERVLKLNPAMPTDVRQIKISTIADRQTLVELGFGFAFPFILKNCSSANFAPKSGVTNLKQSSDILINPSLSLAFHIILCPTPLREGGCDGLMYA